MHEQSLKVRLEIKEAWMYIANPDIDPDTAATKLKELGNEILEIDYKNRRIKVGVNKGE